MLLWTVNFAAVAAVCIVNYFYQAKGLPFSLKWKCSAVFAVLAVVNLIYLLVVGSCNMLFCSMMAAGALLAFCGDVLIHTEFIKGAAVFAAGHLCFAAAYYTLQKPRLLDFILGGVLFLCAAALLAFYPRFSFGGNEIKAACFAYALIISFMLGKAISCAVLSPSACTVLVAVGSLLFFISDAMLLFYCFTHGCRWANNACAATYYPAVCLLVMSMCTQLAV